MFARLLDDEAGHFAIRPVGEAEVSRAYADQTMTLQSTQGNQRVLLHRARSRVRRALDR